MTYLNNIIVDDDKNETSIVRKCNILFEFMTSPKYSPITLGVGILLSSFVSVVGAGTILSRLILLATIS